MEAEAEKTKNLILELVSCAEMGQSADTVAMELKKICEQETNLNYFHWWLASHILSHLYGNYGPMKCVFHRKDNTKINATFHGNFNQFFHPEFNFADNVATTIIFNDFLHSAGDCSISWEDPRIENAINNLSKILSKYIPLAIYPSPQYSEFAASIEEPLSDVVAILRESGAINIRETLSILKRQKSSLEATLKQAVNLITSYLDHAESANIDSVLEHCEKQGLFAQLDKPVEIEVRKIINDKLHSLFYQRSKVAAYRAKYENAPWGLLVELYGLNEQLCKGHVSAEWHKDYVILVINDNNIFNKIASKHSSNDVSSYAGWAEVSGEGICIVKQYDKMFTDEVKTHEARHQRNRFLLNNRKKELASAQDEIVAYLSDGSSCATILDLLTQSNGPYDYYKEEKKKAVRPQEKEAIEKQWKLHCRRVFKGIQAVAAIANPNLDELTMTPLSQWRKFSKGGKGEDFFIESSATSIPEGLLEDVKAILNAPENANLIKKACNGSKWNLASQLANKALCNVSILADRETLLCLSVGNYLKIYFPPSIEVA